MPMVDFGSDNTVKNHIAETSVALPANVSYSQLWSDYAVKLSRVFCSFLPASEDIKSHDLEASTGQTVVAVSSLYGELSIKWVMRVLVTVFPCIKACSNQNDLPSHLRWTSISSNVPSYVSLVRYCLLFVRCCYLSFNVLVQFLSLSCDPFFMFVSLSVGSLSILCNIVFWMHLGRFLFHPLHPSKYFGTRESGNSYFLSIFSTLDQLLMTFLESVAHTRSPLLNYFLLLVASTIFSKWK